jgi:hypothetical protein
MSINPYFSINNLDDNSSYQFPKIFQINRYYLDLSMDAKVCWAILNGLQRYCSDIGWFERKSGKIYFYQLDLIIEKFVIKHHTNISAHQLIEELLRFQLLETDELSQNKLKRYYLLKPKHNFTELRLSHKEELDFLCNIQQMVESDSRNKSFLLKEFIEEKEIVDDFVIKKLYDEVILKGKDEPFDVQKLENLYHHIHHTNNNEKISNNNEPKNENEDLLNRAEKFMGRHLTISEKAQLTPENILVLYKNFDKINILKRQGLINISFLLSLKTKYKLNPIDFGSLLENALHLYDINEKNHDHFAYFFEQLIQNKEVVDKERILIDEITNKLYELPNHLKRFVYDQMIKISEHFPNRYQLLIHNLSVINKVYQDKGGQEKLPDEVFKTAFRGLGLDTEIHNIVAYFKKGIEFALQDILKETNKVQKETPASEKTKVDEKTWLETIIDVKETKGDIDKMNEEERKSYFDKAEQIRKKLEMLKRDN